MNNQEGSLGQISSPYLTRIGQLIEHGQLMPKDRGSNPGGDTFSLSWNITAYMIYLQFRIFVLKLIELIIGFIQLITKYNYS